MERLVSTRVNTRSSLACLECRTKHVKCDAKQPRCSRCTAYDKACQYTASRRGGLDRAALTERRRRLAKNSDAQLDHIASEISVAVSDEGVTLADESVTGADCLEVFHASLPVPTPVLENRETPNFSHGGLTDDSLVKSYYANFHHLHPFAPPYKHLVQLSQASAFNFSPLIASMRLIGHIYDTHQWSESLSSAAEAQLSQSKPSDAVQVQARLLYSIALFWYTFKAEAKEQMDAAIDVAIKLEMHKKEFATTWGFGDPIMVECWRRTWWMLFIADASYAGTLGTMNFKTLHVEPTAELPCEEADYESGVSASHDARGSDSHALNRQYLHRRLYRTSILASLIAKTWYSRHSLTL